MCIDDRYLTGKSLIFIDLEIHLHSLFFFCSFLILCFRDHPDTIKRRFISVSVICVIIPILLQCFGTTSNAESVSLQDNKKFNQMRQLKISAQYV